MDSVTRRYSGVSYGTQTVCQQQQGKSKAPAPDPSIAINAAAQAEASKAMLELGREQLAWNKETWNEAKPVYNDIIQAQLEAMRQANERSDEQWDQYKRLFQPAEEKLVKDAMEYDTPERREANAAKAAAGVAQAHDAADAQLTRSLETAGMDPNDPRYAFLKQEAGLARAKDTAGAMNTSRTQTELTGKAMVQSAAQFGRNMPQTSIAQDAAALGAGNSASANRSNATNSYNSGVASAGSWYSGGIAGLGSANQSLLGMNQAQQNAAAMSNANATSTASGIGSLAGMAAMAMMMKDGGLVSKERMKMRRYADGGAVEAGEGSEAGEDGPSIDPADGALIERICAEHAGLPVRDMRGGTGKISGPGTSTSDSVPAMVSDGEAVLNAEAVQILGEDFVERINAAGLARRGGGMPAGAPGGRGVETEPIEGEYERVEDQR